MTVVITKSRDLSGYRGRLAPSPTGELHLGHARTFWVAAERARGGTLVLRNEDLDPQRSQADFWDAIVRDLRWFGITWQEGPDSGGAFAPYEQSKRREHYLAAWRALKERGAIYPCSCSRKDLAGAAQAPHENAAVDDEPLYPGTCRQRHVDASEPRGYNWRFRVPDGRAIRFDDQNLGPQEFVAGHDFGDFVVWRRDDVPAYQLACVVDDAAMQITEVVRREDLLKSTARQLLLFEALGLEPPAYFHCELVRDDKGERLAKRHDALSLRTLRERGMSAADVRRMWR